MRGHTVRTGNHETVGLADRAGFILAWTVAATALASEATAQQPADTRLIEEIVTVGTRTAGRTAIDSPVPVDVFDQNELQSVGTSADLTDVISKLVPSFNVGREPISDGATFVRPPNLRGLDSDKTLVLVDGKRRHRAALVRLGGFGSHGPDLAAIPVIALRSVEVLRDGAGAQYGSDAIAGVLNLNLKGSAATSDIQLHAGAYPDGGDDQRVAAHVGFDIGNAGFVNLSGEFARGSGTSRGTRYDLPLPGGSGLTPYEASLVEADTDGDGIADRFGPDVFTEVRGAEGRLLSLVAGADGIPDDTSPRFREHLRNPEQIWGEPARIDRKVFVNAALPLGVSREAYGFANWRGYDANGSFFYRRPGVQQLLPVRLRDGTIYDPRDRFPGGFTPRFFGHVGDYGLTAGIRGASEAGLSWDLSVRGGENSIEYRLENTWNPSLGPSSPTVFHPGDLVTDEWSLNADFSQVVDTRFAGELNIAFGFEYREEGYALREGDRDSYTPGPFASADPFNFEITRAEVDADPDDDLTAVACRIPGQERPGPCVAGDPINNAMPVGSNGFPGYAPAFTSAFDRGSGAVYVDLEADVSERLLVGVAGRLEDYPEFGRNFSWKVAGNYALSDAVSLRASAGTGFRAPTPGQISTTNVSTRINDAGVPVAEGIFPATHPVSAFFGAQPLHAEQSTQMTLGVAATPTERLTVSVDYYLIELRDRIVLSSDFLIGPPEVRALQALGVPGAHSIAQVSFFNNDLDTESRGIDVVATYSIDSPAGLTQASASLTRNVTRVGAIPTRIDRHGNRFSFVNAEDVFDTEHALPKFQGVFTLRHWWERFDVMGRLHWYGDYSHANTTDFSNPSNIQRFDGKMLVDVQAAWRINDAVSAMFGGLNVLDEAPDRAAFEACCGRIYRSDSMISWQGAYYYLRLQVGL